MTNKYCVCFGIRKPPLGYGSVAWPRVKLRCSCAYYDRSKVAFDFDCLTLRAISQPSRFQHARRLCHAHVHLTFRPRSVCRGDQDVFLSAVGYGQPLGVSHRTFVYIANLFVVRYCCCHTGQGFEVELKDGGGFFRGGGGGLVLCPHVLSSSIVYSYHRYWPRLLLLILYKIGLSHIFLSDGKFSMPNW